MTAEDFDAFVTLYGKSIYSFCCHITGNVEDAKDLYQDTFLKATELRQKLDGDSTFEESKMIRTRNYLIGIAVRIWKNQTRKNYIRQPVCSLNDEENGISSFISDGKDIEEEILLAETKKELKNIINELPEKMRIVLYMHYTAGMKLDEIAKVLHIPNGTVKSRMHKAKIHITNLMEAKGYEI